jgi:cytochrome c oxidase subunit 3
MTLTHSRAVTFIDRADHHDPDVPHQFEDLAQKNECDIIGMWTFLATEVLFFGGLFAALMLYRTLYHEAFVEASNHLYQGIGCFNTFVLLFSSYTVVLAVHAAKHGKNGQLIFWLFATALLGATFLGVKVLEYSKDFNENLVPHSVNFGLNHEEGLKMDEPENRELLRTHPEIWLVALKNSGWKVSTDRSGVYDAKQLLQHAQLFFVFYYTMTMIHAVHMIVGLGLFAFLVVKAAKGKYTPRHHNQVEICGLYWHFVDIVWIFLFPLLYLMV